MSVLEAPAPETAARPAELPPLPALVDGIVAHRRFAPFDRAFRHRAYQWLVDLDALPRASPLASFRAADHLGDAERTIKQNVVAFLAEQGIDLRGGRVLMLANARVLGYVFNPLTVFWCLDERGVPACVVAEVHNTYGGRHAYLLRPDAAGRAAADKRLYVSPFFDVSGHYALRFSLSPDRVGAEIVLHRDGERAFAASFHGRPRPASGRAVLALALRRPLMPQRVSTLIRIHGVRLWARRLPVVPRPTENGPR